MQSIMAASRQNASLADVLLKTCRDKTPLPACHISWILAVFWDVCSRQRASSLWWRGSRVKWHGHCGCHLPFHCSLLPPWGAERNESFSLCRRKTRLRQTLWSPALACTVRAVGSWKRSLADQPFWTLQKLPPPPGTCLEYQLFLAGTRPVHTWILQVTHSVYYNHYQPTRKTCLT